MFVEALAGRDERTFGVFSADIPQLSVQHGKAMAVTRSVQWWPCHPRVGGDVEILARRKCPIGAVTADGPQLPSEHGESEVGTSDCDGWSGDPSVDRRVQAFAGRQKTLASANPPSAAADDADSTPGYYN